MLLTEAPSLRTLRSRAPLVWREGGRSGPPPPPPLPPPPPPPPSSPSPRSEGSGSESERRDEVEGGDKWSTEPTGDVADSGICNPARLCAHTHTHTHITLKWVTCPLKIGSNWLTRIWTDSSCEVSVYQSASPSSGAAPRSITTWRGEKRAQETSRVDFSSMNPFHRPAAAAAAAINSNWDGRPAGGWRYIYIYTLYVLLQ